jgi:hypothetical protein
MAFDHPSAAPFRWRAPPHDAPSRVTPSPRLERLATSLALDFDRTASAYHEAGHAVAGFWHGWSIAPAGVEIDVRQRCSFMCAAYAYTPEARAVVAMAGWLAEHKWHRQGGTNWNDQLIHILDAHDWGQVQLDDERMIVKALVGNRDPDDVETRDFLLAVDAFREQATALMAHPKVWRSIRNVSRALMAKGRLSEVDVVNAIDPDDFLSVSHGRWTAGSG